MSQGPGVVLVCGRFEGIDERRDRGPAPGGGLDRRLCALGRRDRGLALIDACVRLLPGVMGAEASSAEESFTDGLLEYPHYTRPQVWEGRPIPEILTVRRPCQGRSLAPFRG